MPREAGVLSPSERRRLSRAGFTRDEIYAIDWNYQIDKATGQRVLTPMPYFDEGRLDHPMWQKAMKSHRDFMTTFLNVYLYHHPDATIEEQREAYRKTVLEWQLREFKQALPWIWIDEQYQPGTKGAARRKQMEAARAIAKLETEVEMYFD